MNLDALDDFIGPRTIAVFVNLLLVLVSLLFLGTVLSTLYEIRWLEQFTLFFVDRPNLVLTIAGTISTGILIVKGIAFLQNVDF